MTTFRLPSWRNAKVEFLTEEKLAAMKAEALEIDAHNEAVYSGLKAAYDGYVAAWREAYGNIPEVFRRQNGRRYVQIPAGMGTSWLRNAEDLERRRAQHLAEVTKQREADSRVRETEQRRLQLVLDLGRLIERQKLTSTSWDSALDELCSRNRYLPLAVAGILTRGDWSEGFWRVRDAFRRFPIETDTDAEIAKAYAEVLSSEETDGRVFRDIAWSYDALLEMVGDPDLVADVRKCLDSREACR